MVDVGRCAAGSWPPGPGSIDHLHLNPRLSMDRDEKVTTLDNRKQQQLELRNIRPTPTHHHHRLDRNKLLFKYLLCVSNTTMTAVQLPLQRPARVACPRTPVARRAPAGSRAPSYSSSSSFRHAAALGSSRRAPARGLVALRAGEGAPDAQGSPQSTAGAQAVANQDLLIDQLLAASSDEEFLRVVTEKCATRRLLTSSFLPPRAIGPGRKCSERPFFFFFFF